MIVGLSLHKKKEDYTYEGTFEGDIIDSEPYNGTDGNPFSYDFNYTGAFLIQKNGFKADKEYKIEARIKIPEGVGIWPAFWSYQFPDEVDYFEVFNKGNTPDSKYSSTLHAQESTYICERKENAPSFGEFHIWSATITPSYIKIYIDGNLETTLAKYQTISGIDVGLNCIAEIPGIYLENLSFPDTDNWFRAYLTIGCNIEKANLDEVFPLPAKMEVDYVRIYQKIHCGSQNDLIVDQDMTLNDDASFGKYYRLNREIR